MSSFAYSLPRQDYLTYLRIDLVGFIERSFRELNPNTNFMYHPYIDLMASKLEACRRGKIKRLIINLPPRALKSHAVSVAFVAWLLGQSPSAQIICASYGQDLADKHARDTRTVMQSQMYREIFPATRLSTDRMAVNDFMTTLKGNRMATSVGGVLTGRGADFIILDDVMKPDEALSETRRKTSNEWYTNSLLSRLNSKENGVIIIVMQRLHQDDLVGHVLESGEQWEVLSLPAIAQEDVTYEIDRPFGPFTWKRLAGESLHPERDSVKTFESIRREIGSYNFESQYQQSPLPVEGGYIKRDWIQYYDQAELPERFTITVQSWDTASKSGELNDFTVCTTWGYREGKYYLLDVVRLRLNFPDLKREFKRCHDKYRPRKVLIEEKSSGIALIQEVKGQGITGIEAIKAPPGNDKVMRLVAQTAKFEARLVLIPRDTSWTEEYVRELTGFPGTRFDDQVDSTTQALEFLGQRAHSNGLWARLGQAS